METIGPTTTFAPCPDPVGALIGALREHSANSGPNPPLSVHYKKKEPLEVHWDGKQSRVFCYVRNVVKANLLAMNTPGIAGEAFNISGPREANILELAKELQSLMGVRKTKFIFKPKRPGDVRRTCADLHKSERLLGYRDLVSFREGLKKTVGWFLANPGSFD